MAFRLTVILSELKLGNVQMQILPADHMKRSDNAALQDRPEALNRISVNCTDNVLANGMVDRLMIEPMLEPQVAGISIRAKQANAIRYRFANESLKRLSIGVLNDASDDVALVLDRADNCRLASVSSPPRATFLVPMSVLLVSADVGFIDLDNPAQLLRAQLKSLGPGEPPDSELDAGECDEGCEGVGEVLVILGQAPVSPEPGKGSFDDPATRQDDKS